LRIFKLLGPWIYPTMTTNTARMKRKWSLTRVLAKDSLALIWLVGTNFSWKINSREEFDSVDLSILVKFKLILFPMPFKVKIFYAKLNQEWEKLQFLLSQS